MSLPCHFGLEYGRISGVDLVDVDCGEDVDLVMGGWMGWGDVCGCVGAWWEDLGKITYSLDRLSQIERTGFATWKSCLRQLPLC